MKTLVEIDIDNTDMISELLKLAREAAEKRGDSNCVICAQHGYKFIWPPNKLVLISNEHHFDCVCFEHYKNEYTKESEWNR